MARVPTVTRDTVPEQLLEAFDATIAMVGQRPPGSGTISSGASSILLNSPEVARRANQLGAYLRNESTLSHKVVELAILTTSRAMDFQPEWNGHVPVALKAGISDALMDALRDNKPLPPMSPEESAVISFGMEFFKTHRVSKETFEAGIKQFGVQGLTELATLMGFYAMLAFNANAFEIDLPAELTEPLLPV